MGRRPTVASGMARSLKGMREPTRARLYRGSPLPCTNAQARRGQRDPRLGPGCLLQETVEPHLLDPVFELFAPIHQDDRHAQAILPLESVVPVDEHLPKTERRSPPF